MYNNIVILPDWKRVGNSAVEVVVEFAVGQLLVELGWGQEEWEFVGLHLLDHSETGVLSRSVRKGLPLLQGEIRDGRD